MATCYIDEGADMPEFGPCNTTASVSLCCLSGQICLSNGFCSTQYGQIYSGACTDPTYSSSICPEFCTFATGGVITQCGRPTLPLENGRFCCSMDANKSCCDDPKNKLHMAPPISSAIAMMPGIATSAASSTSASTSSTGLLSSASPSSTLNSTQTSLNNTLSTTAITPTTEPTPTSNGTMMKLGIGLGVGLGVVALALLLWGIYAFHRRRQGREKYHRSLAKARIDAWNTARRARTSRWPSARNRTENPPHGERGVGSSEESAKTESVPERGHTLASSEAVPSIIRTLASSAAVTTTARTLPAPEAALTRVHTLASSDGNAESRPASALPTVLPNSPIEQVEPNTHSPVDGEPTPELGPDTSGSSDTSESDQHNATPPQPTTSTRSKTTTSAQLDGASDPSPDTDLATTRVPTAEEGSNNGEPAQDKGKAPAKPAESLQVEGEIQRQWSWQQGDDEHFQRSLEERMGLDEQVQQSPEE